MNRCRMQIFIQAVCRVGFAIPRKPSPPALKSPASSAIGDGRVELMPRASARNWRVRDAIRAQDLLALSATKCSWRKQKMNSRFELSAKRMRYAIIADIHATWKRSNRLADIKAKTRRISSVSAISSVTTPIHRMPRHRPRNEHPCVKGIMTILFHQRSAGSSIPRRRPVYWTREQLSKEEAMAARSQVPAWRTHDGSRHARPRTWLRL